MKKLLVIETTLGGAFVALGILHPSGDFTWVAAENCNDHQGSARLLPRMTRQVLDFANWPWHEVGGILVGLGPGSFTGIKIGLSFVAGLASGCPVPPLIAGFSGLGAILVGSRAAKSCFAATVLPSTQTRGFAAIACNEFDSSGKAFELWCVTERGILEAPRGKKLESGDRKQLLLDKSIALLNPWAAFENECLLHGDSSRIVGLDERNEWLKLGVGDFLASGSLEFLPGKVPQPNYMRPSTAEEKRWENAERKSE